MSALAGARQRAIPSALKGWSTERLLYGALLVGAAVYIAAFVLAAALRLSFPYPLEITEGASLESVRALLRGEPLYTRPTVEHVPMIYGPIYFYAAAVVSTLLGPSFVALRLTSLLASAGSIACSYLIVKRETDSRAGGLIAAGVLSATYPLADGALDLGRVDALLLCLLLASVYAARGATWRWAAASGSFLALAILTKQAAAPVAAALLLYFAVAAPGRLLAFAIALIGVLVVVLGLLEAQSGHWATLFLLQLPLQHQISDFRLGAFWTVDVLPRLTLPFVLGPLFLLHRDWRTSLFYAFMSASMIGIAWAANSNPGAAANVRLPAYGILAVIFGLGFFEALRLLSQVPDRRRPLLFAYGVAVGLFQLALLVYNPRQMVPYRSDAWADQRLSATLQALPGKVFAPDFDAFMNAGEQPFTGSAAELVGGYGGRPVDDGLDWIHQVDARLQQHQYDAVVLDPESPLPIFKGAVDRAGYADAGPLFPQGDEFWLWRTGIEPKAEVYVPAERLAAQKRTP